ncbi:sulfotransferase domain-containing protein [Bacillus sp. JJ1533]|uniref:sulfotransferase domain-containing protein n=1 Tax=Bacillus sp. JJ1533 TaxID=3122959 RepID=UPI0030009E57
MNKMIEQQRMPDFLIIGAQKCGTTSLYNYLIKHPNVVPAKKKEVHFFDYQFEKGIAWYRKHFPLVFENNPNLITGEASPYYIFHPHAPQRISEMMPRVKIIVMLRNPVDRAYSHFQHEIRLGAETLSFEEAIEKEAARLQGEKEKMMKDENYYSYNHQHYSYLSRGIYVDQLKAWMEKFPKKQFLIVKSEDFFYDPLTVFDRVLHFLNLPVWELNKGKKYNAGHYSKMDDVMRKHLIDYFKPHNQRLYEILGENLDWEQ